jgi:two-component system, cell cycle sensor histidine kinase and response regulator CckA
MAVLGELAAGIAHEFKNILHGIGMYADFIATDGASAEAVLDDVTQIRESVARGKALAGQLSELADPAPAGGPVELVDAVRSLVPMIKVLLGNQVPLRVELPEAGLLVGTGKVPLGQMLLNLAINARDAMPDGGSLTIAVESRRLDPADAAASGSPAGSLAVVTVADTGVGIDPAIISHVFEPFFTTLPMGSSLGLGLSAALDIATSAGGAIRVESEPGRGATFTIYLPLVTGADRAG